MSKKIRGGVFTCLLLAASLQGCVTRHGDFSVLSNKLINVADFNLSRGVRTPDVTGEDISHIIIFIPTNAAPSLEGALDDAFRKADGDVMTDAVVEYYGWYIPYIYGQMGWRVRGDVVKTRP